MRPIRLIVYLLLISVAALNAQEKYSKVKVYYSPSDIAARNNIISMLQIDHFQEDNGAVISEVSASLLEKLKTAGIQYDVLTDDVAENLARLNKEYYASLKGGKPTASSAQRVAIEVPGSPVSGIIKTPAAFTVQPGFGGYYTFAQMNAAMDALVAAYPGIASKTSLGTTAGGNNIWLIKISDNVSTDETNEPEILYMGLQHAREAITGSSMIFFMQYLCEQYAAGDSKIKDLVDNREIYIIPCFNPDGWEYNRTSKSGNAGGGWRKNRSNSGGGNFGVDLNRNWGIDWGNCSAPISGPPASCGTNDPTQETYWGSAAFSELETQAVRNFAQTHHLVAGFDQHAYGPYYSLPFGRHSLHTLSAKGTNFYTAVPALMGTYNGMRAADSYDALGYEVAGGFKDWMLMGDLGTGTKDTVWAMTGEGAAGGGTPAFGTYADFWAPASQIVNLSAGMCYQNLQLAFAAGSYVDIQDVNDMDISALTGNFNFTAQRLGLGNDPVTVSLIPLENIQSSGAPVTISSLPNYYQTASGSISYSLYPSLPVGQRIKFVWKVSTGGYTYADTITKFYKPTVLFTDDMETAGSFTTNWVSTSDVSDKWAYTTLSPYGGTHALTESPAGNYTASTTRILKHNGTFSLTGSTSAFLSFWTKHRAENFRDKMQVQVSTNGTSWTAVQGSTTIEEPGTLDGATLNGVPALTGIRDYWTHEVYDLSAYNNTATLSFRFVFTSDNDPSSFKYEKDDGFYIDNIKLIKSNTIFFNLLPVNFISFSGNLFNNEIGLNWEMTTGKSHAWFEVEKSADAIGFTSIGKVTSGAPFVFTDYTPYNGNNYYRIKEVDVNGKAIYSKTINVPYNSGKADVSIYPNPVTDMLHVKINDIAVDFAGIQITDVHGRVVYAGTDIANNGNEITVNTHSFVPQLYILKITGKQGNLISIQKFIKH